jgi:5-methylcytosine-specific restriction endonuclease McrA
MTLICKDSVSLECYNYYLALVKGDNNMTSKKNKERERLQAIYGGLYKRHFITEGYKCFYCGETAQCLDHSPALSVLEGLPRGYMKRNKIPHTLLTSCYECNAALGGKSFLTAFERLMYLESYYEAFFKKQMGRWDEEELSEMGTNLKRYIKHEKEKLDIYLQKIRAIQLRQLKPETYPTYTKDEENEENT